MNSSPKLRLSNLEIVFSIVLIFDGKSAIGAHVVGGNFYYLICLIRSRAVSNRIFSQKKNYFLSCVRNMVFKLPSNISTIVLQ